jgi:hypothetical protein
MDRNGLSFAVVKVDTHGVVTDIASAFFVDSLITSAGNPLEGEKLRIAYLFYHALTTISAVDMIKILAITARDRYDADCLNILPCGSVSPSDCLDARAGYGTGVLYYYINNQVGIDSELYPTEVFVYPGM